MIRFACPGCSAGFTVADEKAGKSGKCPKCQTRFTIPAAAGPAPAPAPADDQPVEIQPCPKCGDRLSVMPTDLGLEIECPNCQTVFKALKAGGSAVAPAPKGGSKPPRPAVVDDDDDRPSKSKRRDDDDEDDDDRPRKRPSRRDDDDEDDDRPSKRSRRDDDEDEDEDDRPSKRKGKKKGRGSKEESKRMTAALLALFAGNLGVHKFYLGHTTAGVVYLLTCGLCGFGSLIDAIIYFTKTDEDFVKIYQRGGKQWF
ncbi:MAG: NINE protein [Fimbriiglobus sp.]|jgi:predicted Zn finger-like uncharacterized protein|nr:NINE protein [Fimbriiglobus sp.]